MNLKSWWHAAARSSIAFTSQHRCGQNISLLQSRPDDPFCSASAPVYLPLVKLLTHWMIPSAPSERAACFSWRRSDVSISFNQSWGMPVLLPPGLTGWAELQLNNCNTFSSSGSEILDQRLQSAEHERINLTVRLHVRSSVCVFIPQQLINAQDSSRVRLAAAVKSHFFSFTHNKTTYLKSNRRHVSIITSRDL